MDTPQTVLGEKSYTDINMQLTNLARARQEFDIAKQAGIDCSQHGEHCDYLIQRLTQIKRAYFPDRP
jgi:hypothetical protein